MAVTRATKVEELQDLEKAFKGTDSAVLVDYRGLKVPEVTELRRQIRRARGNYKVVKNTLAKRALEANAMGALSGAMQGPVGLVLTGADALAAAKVVGDFAKENQKPTVKVGYVDGQRVEASYVERLGKLPGREQLLGEFVGCLNGVMYQMVGALEALRDQRQAQAS